MFLFIGQIYYYRIKIFIHYTKGEYVEFELEKCTCNSNGLGIQACRVSV